MEELNKSYGERVRRGDEICNTTLLIQGKEPLFENETFNLKQPCRSVHED